MLLSVLAPVGGRCRPGRTGPPFGFILASCSTTTAVGSVICTYTPTTVSHRDGDTVTFEEFLQTEMAGLARFAGALTGDHHLAEDVLSDALLTTSLRWHRIAPMEHPLAYVRRIVVSTFLSERRKQRRRRTHTTADPGVLDQAHTDPHNLIDGRTEVKQLLSQLSPQQRTAMVLRYLFDQTDEDIAEALNCSTATVRSHLSHARTALRLNAETAERGRS
jgi:RNA polymerase sigma-70 factor (sigma-E family)